MNKQYFMNVKSLYNSENYRLALSTNDIKDLQLLKLTNIEYLTDPEASESIDVVEYKGQYYIVSEETLYQLKSLKGNVNRRIQI